MAAHKNAIENTSRTSFTTCTLDFISLGVVGDFNTVLHAHKKEGGGAFNYRAGQSFAQCIFDCSLVDHGYKGPLFTWRSGSLREHIDKALGNAQWKSLFPNGFVVNLPLLFSDHFDIWLRSKSESRINDQRCFKFVGGWLEHKDFHTQVKNVWRHSDPWNVNISRLANCLTHWNQDVYGNLFKKKMRLLGHLEGIDRKLLEGLNERLSHLKKELWIQHNSILDHEEAY